MPQSFDIKSQRIGIGNPKGANNVVKVANQLVGDSHPCFIIAEAGSNHNGSLKKALGLIDIAVRAKADAVKFQTFRAEKLYLKTAGQSRYLKINKSIYDIIKEMEMPVQWIPKLAAYCQKKRIIFLSTPTDEECVDWLEPYVPAYKIASYEMTAIPLVEYMAKKKKPMFVSTGTANLEEVRQTIQAIKNAGNDQIILMQCTASYPAPLTAINVRSILTMKREFEIPVGLSDHSREFDVAPMAAVAIGANCIEKHFTFSNDLPGPDHRFALEPNELKLMVQRIRSVEETLGSGRKETLELEKELRQFARRSIFTIRKVQKGEQFTPDNIATLRCGTQKGKLHPAEYKKVLHKTATRNLKAYQAVKLGDYAVKAWEL